MTATTVQISKAVSSSCRVLVFPEASTCRLLESRLTREPNPRVRSRTSQRGLGRSPHPRRAFVIAEKRNCYERTCACDRRPPQRWTSCSNHCGWLTPKHLQLRYPARILGDVRWRWATLVSVDRVGAVAHASISASIEEFPSLPHGLESTLKEQ